MGGVSVFILLGLLTGWGSAQFLNNRPYPTYSLEQMPDTEFSCRDKILGGYYADPETQCQMFHVCVKVAGTGVQDFRFLCPNGTAFDQDHQICAEWEDVDCDATTLYYSSDNFDLYRIGSGYESKAVKYGEDEEPFSLQRAETGDVRLNREHQTKRINQQKETFSYKSKTNNPPQYQTNNENKNYNNNNRNNNNENNEREIFKSSSSSNFFNNRNGGKETDDDEYDNRNVNVNQNDDRYQRAKTARKQGRRPNSEFQTERPQRPTGFVNNFAGSSYIPTTARSVSTTNNNPVTTTNTYRTRQRNPQYNNANNFRQSTPKPDDGQYRETSGQFSSKPQPFQFAVSTPAPFRQAQQYNGENNGRQTTFNNGQYNAFNKNSTTSIEPSTKVTENYPASFIKSERNNQYTPTKNTENPSTPVKKTENYPTPTTQIQNKATENYPIFPINSPKQPQINNNQYELTKTKPTENYPSTIFNTQNTKKPTTAFKQSDNIPTTFSPKTNQYKNPQFSEQSTTAAPALSNDNRQATQYTSKQNTQYTPSTNYNQQYDTPVAKISQSTYHQPQTFKQTHQYSPTTQQQKQTTQFTQYTPTVPRITTPYYSSTTQFPIPRRSHRFDETQYDDGTYNTRYDGYDDKNKEDEFLKTAHSTNIANSRNEYIQNTRRTAVSTTQKPRPFSAVTQNVPRGNDFTKSTSNVSPNVANVKKSPPPPPPPQPHGNNQKQTPKSKNVKDASYDYAYYDSNVGVDHEYDLGVDIEKSDKTKSKKQ